MAKKRTSTKRIVSKSIKPPVAKPIKRTVSKPAVTNVEKKLAAISDSTKILSKEIKATSKIFAENHKMLSSMKEMISILSNTMQHIDKHSKQIRLLEMESKNINSELQQVRQKIDLIKSSSDAAKNMETRISAIENDANFTQVKQSVIECVKIVKNSSQILGKLSDSSNKPPKINLDNVEKKLDANAKMLQDVEKILHQHVQSQEKEDEGDIVNETSQRITTISREIAGLREQVRSVSESQKTDELTEHMGSISTKAEVLMGVPSELLEIQSRLDSIETKVSNKDQDASPDLVLFEYQAQIRAVSESKYGQIEDLQYMAMQTSNVIEKIGSDGIEGKNIAKWGVGRILECVDKWELRFSDALAMMKKSLGGDVLKNAIRIKQVKDVYGVRAVEETKTSLEMS